MASQSQREAVSGTGGGAMKAKAIRRRRIKRPLLARNLRYLRQQRDWTQKEVADRLYLNRSAYTYYETGASQPAYDTLLRLAEMYGTMVQALLTEDLAAQTPTQN